MCLRDAQFNQIIFALNILLIIKTETNIVEGTVSIISSDPPYTDGSTRFTTVPLKAWSDQILIRYAINACFCFFKLLLILFVGSLQK